MKKVLYQVLLFFFVLLESNISFSQQQLKHYIFVNRDRDRIYDSLFLETPQLKGAQIKYTWRELEPEKNQYDFRSIQDDLKFLKSKNKTLFIQLQDISFDTTIINVPHYLLQDTVYHGGVNPQYSFEDDTEKVYIKAGWVARRWDPAVAKRFHLLLMELGKTFDGKIDGINLPETAIEFGSHGNLFPSGFTYLKYKEATKQNMLAIKKAFPNTPTIIYINFMPGEFLPWINKSFLSDLFAYAKKIKVGVGGPDLLPYKKGQMNNSYRFIKNCHGIIPTGVAIQWGNYDHINPQTGKQVTIPEIIAFAKNELKLDYIFWCLQPPHFTEKVIPTLKSSK